MSVAIITGSAGLIGAESVRFFSSKGFDVAGIDNNMRQAFFGPDASTEWSRRELVAAVPRYTHHDADIRDTDGINAIFARYGNDIALVVHTAAQPSHDWAAKDPPTDFSVNANGTLVMLEATRKHCPRRGLHLHLDEQGLRRQPQLPAAGRAGVAVGSRPGAPLRRARHRRDDVASIRRNIRSSASPSWRPTPWPKSTAATSA